MMTTAFKPDRNHRDRTFIVMLVCAMLISQIFCQMPVSQHDGSQFFLSGQVSEVWSISVHDGTMYNDECETEPTLFSITALADLTSFFVLIFVVLSLVTHSKTQIRNWLDQGSKIQASLPPIYLRKASFLE